MQRRELIKAGVGVAVLMLGGGGAYQVYQQSQLDYSGLDDLSFLSKDDQLVLIVLFPVICSDLPEEINVELTLKKIDQAIDRLPQSTQDELKDLFGLLSSLIGRLVIAGLWENWQNSSRSELHNFLKKWRKSPLALLQKAYIGLCQLIWGSIYSQPEHWTAIGYSGPPFRR
ncbi:hypothetical protein [Aliikangiella sp. G2MR2-5]|uniref:hypothetical protein n=1 Tax=Aliikangiella sp. G2MR2-5 TaxID=2788943 RepID=UPI0018AB9D2F|nr:hypothetical protein [Aliikangiella sp. G2MR2-5]